MVIPRSSIHKNYDEESLLGDGSVNWDGVNRENLLAQFRRDMEASRIEELRHTEVR